MEGRGLRWKTSVYRLRDKDSREWHCKYLTENVIRSVEKSGKNGKDGKLTFPSHLQLTCVVGVEGRGRGGRCQSMD